ncbi:hypothetical protein AB0N73_00055 [Microbacterium sp. NPDC089189]|uniref:hypothetical protein n=1 Tax=Microbacterium sp. NPDC089189 TaxID=3154972 RepID=UPI003435947F
MTEDTQNLTPDEEYDVDDAYDVDEFEDEEEDVPPQYGVWPFSIREIVLIGIWVVAFVFSFFSLYSFGFQSVWTAGLTWVLTIGAPTVAVFLLVLRRLSPQGIRRFGSLGIDQFASVAFSVSALLWLQFVWDGIAAAVARGAYGHSWVPWAELVLMLGGVVFTVVSPFIPTIREDFAYREEVVAHPNASPMRPVAPRPAPEPRPAAPVSYAPDAAYGAAVQAPQGATSGYPVADAGWNAPSQGAAAPAAATDTGAYGDPAAAETTDANDSGVIPSSWYDQQASPTEVFETSGYTAAAAEQESVAPEAAEQRATTAFWALAPEERDVLDDSGAPLFRIGPTAWALVIEDRGEAFVVRHEDGRIGYLHDVSGVTRG